MIYAIVGSCVLNVVLLALWRTESDHGKSGDRRLSELMARRADDLDAIGKLRSDYKAARGRMAEEGQRWSRICERIDEINEDKLNDERAQDRAILAKLDSDLRIVRGWVLDEGKRWHRIYAGLDAIKDIRRGE